MILEFYIKSGKKYELRSLEVPNNAGTKYFKSLLLNIKIELDNIRDDILSFSTLDKIINLKIPQHDDEKIQEKLDKLVRIRQVNLKCQEYLQNILKDNEFIICKCGAKMYKRPIGVPFYKFGNDYIIKERNMNDLKYAYFCTECVNFVEEELYEQKRRNRITRERLLKKGKKFVPNDFGFWYYVD